jgi:iron complex outermembrane receptor protein
MVYATVQTGYVPGGYSQLQNTPTQSNEVFPEKLRSYTLGTKNTFLSQRLLINDEIYYYDYSNYQVVAVSAATGINTIFNAQNAKIYGDQLNVTYLVTNALQIDVGANAMSAYFRSLELPGGLSYVGYQLANAPPLMLDLGGQYKFGPFDFGDLTFGVHTHHEAGRWAQFDHFDDTYQKAYFKTDVDATYRPRNGNWSFALWARNLENVPVIGASAGGGQPGPASVFLEPPRTFGARFAYHW